MIDKINKKLKIFSAREELRLPTEAEASDRTLELLALAAAIAGFAAAITVWSKSAPISLQGFGVLLAPIATLWAWRSARAERLAKLELRRAFFQAWDQKDNGSE